MECSGWTLSWSRAHILKEPGFALTDFAFAVVFGTQLFQLAVLDSAPALEFLLAGLVEKYRKRCGKDVLVGIMGIVFIFAATLLKQMQVDIHPVYFTYNDVWNALQGVVFLMLFNSVGALSKHLRARCG